jgi:cbb3-type cytochrome oxidase subunit 3
MKKINRVHDTLVFVFVLFPYVYVYYLFRVSQKIYVLLSVKA